jgi:Pyruvate/2-oxoacid:ferredoxin oxidoreductase delta subunit
MLRRALQLLHGFVYGRWTRRYIGVMRGHVIPRLSPEGKKKLADGWHAKVLTHENAKAIVSVNYAIPRRDLEQIIPYASARTLVLKAPPEIVVYKCACRHTRENPCQPTQVCMMIGRSVGDFRMKHHPAQTRRIGQAEALELLRAEHERGHVHSAWFKDAIGGRFYALCNCCRCCCFGIGAMLEQGVPIVASSGYVAEIDASRCSACTACRDACPFEAIEMNGEPRVSWAKCMGCGVCTTQCPEQAVSLVRDERKGIPLDVRLFGPRPDAAEARPSSHRS